MNTTTNNTVENENIALGEVVIANAKYAGLTSAIIEETINTATNDQLVSLAQYLQAEADSRRA